MVAEDQQVADMWSGTGEISFSPAVGEEPADLAPVRMGMGIRLSMSYSVTEVRDVD